MQFKTIAFGLATLFATVNACGCRDQDGQHIESTSESCCNQVGADFEGVDCVADSMSESLRDYDECCQSNKLISDCDYPDPIGDIFG